MRRLSSADARFSRTLNLLCVHSCGGGNSAHANPIQKSQLLVLMHHRTMLIISCWRLEHCSAVSQLSSRDFQRAPNAHGLYTTRTHIQTIYVAPRTFIHALCVCVSVRWQNKRKRTCEVCASGRSDLSEARHFTFWCQRVCRQKSHRTLFSRHKGKMDDVCFI